MLAGYMGNTTEGWLHGAYTCMPQDPPDAPRVPVSCSADRLFSPLLQPSPVARTLAQQLLALSGAPSANSSLVESGETSAHSPFWC
jgi:hypothetical protein